MAGNAARPGATVTSRALALVGAFDAEHPRQTLTALASRAGLPVPTAHRLLGELVSWGALDRTPEGRYVVGRRLREVGRLAPVEHGLHEAAAPYLADARDATGTSVELVLPDRVADTEADAAAVVVRVHHDDEVVGALVATSPGRGRQRVLGALEMAARGIGRALDDGPR